MRRFLAAAVLALLLLPALAGASWAVEIVEVTSARGIKAWLVKDRTAPVISMSFSFRGGSAIDPPGREGLAAMAATLLGEGAGPLDAEAFKRELDAISASIGLNAELDEIGGGLRTLRGRRERAFELLALMLREPRFDPAAVERIRVRMLTAIERGREVPGRIAGRTLVEIMFAGHPYARNRQGEIETVKAITVEEMRAFLVRALTRDKLIVSVVGDIDETELAPLLDKAFGDLPASGAAADVPEWRGAVRGRTVVIDKPVPQSVVLIAQPGIKRDDPDWYAAFVLNYILGGGGFNSRLMNEVREKRGLAYSVSTSLSPYQRAGLIIASVASANERVAETVDIIRQQWKLIAEQGVTVEELANAKTYLTGSFALNLDSTGSIASLLQGIQADKLGKDFVDRRNGLIEAVTLADINRVAAKLLHAEDLVVVVVGQPKNLVSSP